MRGAQAAPTEGDSEVDDEPVGDSSTTTTTTPKKAATKATRPTRAKGLSPIKELPQRDSSREAKQFSEVAALLNALETKRKLEKAKTRGTQKSPLKPRASGGLNTVDEVAAEGGPSTKRGAKQNGISQRGKLSAKFDDFDLGEDDDAIEAEIIVIEASAARKHGTYSRKWPQEVWNMIIKQLDNEVLDQTRGVYSPNVAGLLEEVSNALALTRARPAGYYRIMFYNIKMDSYGDTATLQSYTNKFTKVVGELAAQDQEPEVEEVNTIYLQGLAPFFYMIVNYCLTDTRELKKEFAVIVQHVRKHALLPNILQQLKDFDKRAAAQTPASIFFARNANLSTQARCTANQRQNILLLHQEAPLQGCSASSACTAGMRAT